MPKLQEQHFGDVQEVRYAEIAGTRYPEQCFGDVRLPLAIFLNKAQILYSFSIICCALA